MDLEITKISSRKKIVFNHIHSKNILKYLTKSNLCPAIEKQSHTYECRIEAPDKIKLHKSKQDISTSD